MCRSQSVVGYLLLDFPSEQSDGTFDDCCFVDPDEGLAYKSIADKTMSVFLRLPKAPSRDQQALGANEVVPANADAETWSQAPEHIRAAQKEDAASGDKVSEG